NKRGEAPDVLRREVDALRAREQALRDELADLDLQMRALDLEEAAVLADAQLLCSLEDVFSRNYNEYISEVQLFLDDRDSVSATMERATRQLETLRRSHSLNDAFHIWFDGHFGTINGARLGRLPAVQVPWEEVYAAFGYAATLIERLCGMMQFQLREYSIQPNGSFTRLVRRDDKASYELNNSKDYSFLRLFSFRKFDQAQIALLACLQEVLSFIAAADSNFTIPYSIVGDTIGGISVRLSSTAEDRWTAAMKYFLIDLKWALAWTISRSHQGQQQQQQQQQSKP
ncbi:MAG TPA: hypothetical protein VJB16_05950, partial [archaeon]|nr:hypothetical protein [archaeon]